MPEEIFPVHSRRAARLRRAQMAQHAIAAIILISTGIDHLSRPHAKVAFLPICEIAAGALLLGSLVRDRLRKGHHGGIAWVELAGASMILVESVEKTQGPHHVSFVLLAYVQPLILLLFALFDAQISSARYLKAGDDGFVVRLRLLFRRRIPWEDLRAFRVDGNGIKFELENGGSRRISLKDTTELDAAIAWSVDQFRRRGITEHTVEPPAPLLASRR